MNSINVLKREHEEITEMLSILERISERIRSEVEIDPEHLKRALEFIKVFADRCHHGKEEGILFPMMEGYGVPRAGPIGVMLMEHELGRGYVNEMAEAMERYRAGDVEALDIFAENAEKYIELLKQHIDKENDILFRIAETHIPRDEDEKLLERFEELENEKIGPGRHMELQNILKGLAAIYLKENQ